MSNVAKKIGAEKVKHKLSIEIHYLKAKLSQNCPIFIEIKRGKNLKKETQTTTYDSSTSLVQFNDVSTVDITMHKKGNKFVKKSFSLKLFEVLENGKKENGRVKIDFSQISALKKPIVKREVPLQHCSDNTASLCISVSLEQLSNQVKTSSGSELAGKNLEKTKNFERKNDENLKTKELSDEEIDKIGNFYDQKGDSDNESVDSRMSFSDFILHPRDSELDSESSSSEEEYKQLPFDRLVAHSMPKTSKEYVTPNQNSKALQIFEHEEKAGIFTKREGSTCANCILF